MECPYCGSLRLHHENREGGVVVSYTCRLCTKAFEAEGIGRLVTQKPITRIDYQEKSRLIISVDSMDNINHGDAGGIIPNDEDIFEKTSQRNNDMTKALSSIDDSYNHKYQDNNNEDKLSKWFWIIIMILSFVSLVGRFFN